jgi:hypothetical protein
MIEMPDNGLESRRIYEEASRSLRRSVYLPLLRGVTPKQLEAFDPVTQSLVTGQRETTTVPAQALYLLNSAFVRRQSLSLAGALLANRELSRTARIRLAYRLTLGRAPRNGEVLRASGFLDAFEKDYSAARPQDDAGASEVARVEGPGAAVSLIPADPDNIDRTDHIPAEEPVRPWGAKAAAWMSFVQTLYASAEFRFVR